MTRFWPVWAAYLGIWLLAAAVPIAGRAEILEAYAAAVMRHTLLSTGLYGGIAMSAVFGCFAAMAVWSFLYSARSAHGVAALPIRREGVYLSALAAGIVPLLAANVLAAAIVLLTGAANGWTDLGAVAQWLALVSLLNVCFYGFATLCGQLTGNVLVLPAVYAVLNFTAVVVQFLLSEIFGRFVYGYGGGLMGTGYLSPVVALVRVMGVERLYGVSPLDESRIPVGAELYGWGLAAIYAGFGLVCMALGLLLFRKRRIETAGDVVAVRALKPVFRWCMALGCGLCFACLLDALLGGGGATFTRLLIYMLIGAAIGWFAGEMLIRKSFRVFTARRWAGLGLCWLVIVIGMLGMKTDLFGYERYVPAAADVKSVTLRGGGAEGAVLAEPENVEAALALHREIIEDRAAQRELEKQGAEARSCTILYELRDGRTVERDYTVRFTDTPDLSRGITEDLQDLLNRPEAVANRKQTAFAYTAENVVYGEVQATMTVRECAAAEGYEDPALFVLLHMEYMDYEKVMGMSPDLRAELALERMRGWSGDRTADLETLYDSLWYSYTLSLTAEDAWELYSECVVPDLADGTLGKVWILDDGAYMRNAMEAEIRIEARERADRVPQANVPYATVRGDGEYVYDGFWTVPTVDSARVNAWLEARGVALHTAGETYMGEPRTEALYEYEYGYNGKY